MPIELVIVACSILHGAQCKNERMIFFSSQGSLPVFECARYGQSEVAKWSQSHPNWRVQRWRCGPPQLQAKA